MDRWSSRGGKRHRKEESEEKKSEKKKNERQKVKVREKVEKSRNTVFFQCFVAQKGRKVGSLKRRVHRHLGRWDRKNCTPLWREGVKKLKTFRVRSTFGSWNVEKVHGVVARSTSRSQKVQNSLAPLGACLTPTQILSWIDLFEASYMHQRHT